MKRKRIVTLDEQGEGAIRGLAKRFQVSPDSVWLLVKQYQATGSIAPKPHAGGPQATLKAEHHEVLRDLVEADNDATLPQLCNAKPKPCGKPCSSPCKTIPIRKTGGRLR